MKVLYFDCFSGISGDMILGSLIDAGLPLETLKQELSKLPIRGYELKARRVIKGSLSGMRFIVKVLRHTSCTKSFKDICGFLDRCKLDADVKKRAKKLFTQLAKAEGKVHGIYFKNIHFHELSYTDSLIDIVGFCIAIKSLEIDKVYASQLPMGQGIVKTQHGILPLPAPATAGILANSNIRCAFNPSVADELVTPTGAGILATFAEDASCGIPPMRILKVGYGAGERNNHNGIPNLLRAIIGEASLSSPHQFQTDEIEVLEANIDDLNPVSYEYLIEKFLKEGVLDVFITPIQMKKTRPGILLTLLCNPEDAAKFSELLFDETSTFGIRHYRAQRFKLDRKIKLINTKFGRVKSKVGFIGGAIKSVSPEYEDCKRIAETQGVPFKVVYDEAKRKSIAVAARL